jgi:hypothetical protein
MSVANIEFAIDKTTTEAHELVNVAGWLEHKASLRRRFTVVYTPRHRADGPAR